MNQIIARAIRHKFRVAVNGHTLPIPCSQSRTRKDLCDLWGELGYRTGVEIGVFKAEFSREILTRIPACHLTCIDPWCAYKDSFLTDEVQQENYARSLESLKPFGDRVTVRRESSLTAHKDFADESLDFVFIDGDHSFDGCVLDLINWVPKMKKDGMVAVHDYMPMVRGAVRQAVDGYTYAHQIAPWYVICESLPTAFWVKE